MIEFLSRSHDHVVAIKVGGKLTAEDYERELIPKLNQLLETFPSLNILFQMDESFTGWSLEAAMDDTAYALKHGADLGRVAVVGGPTWMRWCINATKFLVPGEMRWFPPSEFEEAWSFVDRPVTEIIARSD